MLAARLPLPIVRRNRLKLAVFNDTSGTSHYGCELVMNELTARLAAHGMAAAWTHPVGMDWRLNRHAIPRPPAIDAVIVNGEGSIHHSASRPRAVYLSQLATFAHRELGVPAFLLNATISDIEDDVAEQLRNFDRIWVRESASRTLLRRWGIESEVVPDLSASASLPIRWRRRGVCGTDSVRGAVSRAIAALCDERGWPFRAMQQRAANNGSRSGAIRTAARFAGWLSAHELVVTGRFHTVTMCVATRTPFVAVESNSPKISSFVRDVFGDVRRVVDCEAIGQLRPVDYQFWSCAEMNRLRTFRTKARAVTARMFADLAVAVRAFRR